MDAQHSPLDHLVSHVYVQEVCDRADDRDVTVAATHRESRLLLPWRRFLLGMFAE